MLSELHSKAIPARNPVRITDICTGDELDVIPALFEVHAAGRPDAVALIFGDQRLTYGELDARANRLAHYLISRGVGPEVLVALAIERSFDMIIALLGVLKAGGAYVPLDPQGAERARSIHDGGLSSSAHSHDLRGRARARPGRCRACRSVWMTMVSPGNWPCCLPRRRRMLSGRRP